MPTQHADITPALQKATEAWSVYRKTSGAQRAAFLRAIAANIEALGDALVNCATGESHLPAGRITGERGRTCAQLRMFADFVEDGRWATEVVEPAVPDRHPQPKPSLRRSWVPVGPVVVFGASNFPLAFSTAGGDTTSALAAGCPVVVKAHEAHPQTNALVADAILRAAADTGMPDGVFETLYGGHDLGQALVAHPLTASVAFTGSFRGGKALFDVANRRPDPIPVFAEMGSVNPVFLLPERLEADHATLASQLAGSICLGVGQFCTNPGLLVAVDSEATQAFARELSDAIAVQDLGKMLTDGIRSHYEAKRDAMLSHGAVEPISKEAEDSTGAAQAAQAADSKVTAAVAVVKAEAFLADMELQEEVFGPFSMLVLCHDAAQMSAVAKALRGQLTATLMATADDVEAHADLVDVLETKAGRIILNGVPTGVEVSPAMHHGGPWPATTDARFTSVGTAAVWRFVRPVCWQGW